MSYSTREIDVPSTVATGGVAGAAAFSGAGGGGCWPFPQAVTLTANAVRMAIRIHGVLKNWLICSSTQKKSDYGHLASAPGGGSLASTERSHQFLMYFAPINVVAASQYRSLSRFVGRQRLDRQRMNIALHQIVDCRVNQSMPGHRRDAAKRLCDDTNSEVAQPRGGAGMAL